MKKRDIVVGLIISLILAVILSPFASSLPDGLEKVAEKFGFLEKESTLLKAPIPDYEFPGGGKLATSLAGLIGTLITFGFTLLIGRGLSRRR